MLASNCIWEYQAHLPGQGVLKARSVSYVSGISHSTCHDLKTEGINTSVILISLGHFDKIIMIVHMCCMLTLHFCTRQK